MIISFRDFSVRKIEIYSGPSIIKTNFQIKENEKELGNVTSCFMLELGNICKGVFFYDTYPAQYKIAHTLFDAVADIIQTRDIIAVDHVCDLLFKAGLKL